MPHGNKKDYGEILKVKNFHLSSEKNNLMTKIGRNKPCPCGSGKKFKKCCLNKQDPESGSASAVSPEESLILTIEKARLAAGQKKELIRSLGVFIIFSTLNGDAWLLEITDSDAVQIANCSQSQKIEITTSAETIEVNWSHSFSLEKNIFSITSHTSGKTEEIKEYPVATLRELINNLKKSLPPHLIKNIHL
jgi:hypothetical protein